MRKMTSTLSVFALICAMAVSAFAQIKGDVTKIDKKAYDSFPAVKESANNKTVFITQGMDLVSDSKADWVLNVTENLSGTITVAYKIGNEYFTVFFEINGINKYWIGEGSGKSGVNHVKVAAFVPDIDDPGPPADDVVVNLGFIGYYINDGKVMSTSIHWQNLEAGDMIDWDAVDAAYDAWVAQGGLEPDRTLWQTSGYASFTFEDYAALGFGDFNIDQLEGFYLNYYVDPGYILPEDEVVANLIFQAFFPSAATGWWGEFFSMQVTLGEETFLDWDGIFAEYEVANTAGRFATNWWSADRVMNWFTSSGGANNGRQTLVQVNGEWPNPVVFTKEMFEAVTTGSNGTITITIRPTLDPKNPGGEEPR